MQARDGSLRAAGARALGVGLPALSRDPRLVDRRPGARARRRLARDQRGSAASTSSTRSRCRSCCEPLEGFFSAYYMLGFGPVIVEPARLAGGRAPRLYVQLRTLLFVSLAIALIVYVAFPTAPPRLVPGLGIADTVGLAGHDTGSFAGVRFNPYAAMPSLHVGWSVLAGGDRLPRHLPHLAAGRRRRPPGADGAGRDADRQPLPHGLARWSARRAARPRRGQRWSRGSRRATARPAGVRAQRHAA